ncbi:hypothetical protein L596_010268 [Steinernema carpocapsae]|uniref:Uncharacterized protein n=1 Tax=Steinernema carpocapsae TaxID=34508 RepID=A0A4U5PI24_STECR|nr:hypothetical protein L596_010268 [Steinernema carpocapsae]
MNSKLLTRGNLFSSDVKRSNRNTINRLTDDEAFPKLPKAKRVPANRRRVAHVAAKARRKIIWNRDLTSLNALPGKWPSPHANAISDLKRSVAVQPSGFS